MLFYLWFKVAGCWYSTKRLQTILMSLTSSFRTLNILATSFIMENGRLDIMYQSFRFNLKTTKRLNLSWIYSFRSLNKPRIVLVQSLEYTFTGGLSQEQEQIHLVQGCINKHPFYYSPILCRLHGYEIVL